MICPTEPASSLIANEPARAPPARQFATYPSSWYLFCESRQLDAGPVSKHVAGRDLVAFRTESGALAVMESRCSHLGADLGRGCVQGETIRCPFHHWQYDARGRCTRIPSGEEIPVFARQVCYPVVQRHGLVFVFNGSEPFFELPFFFDERPDEFVRGKPYSFVADCNWFMLSAHAFDRQHFSTVHSRELTTPLLVDVPHAAARRSRYTAAVVGDSLFDRLLRPFAGPTVDISITTWGGTLILITGTFQRACSYFLIAANPTEDERTLCEVVVFRRRAQSALGRLFQPLDLAIRRWFTRGYQMDEVHQLGAPRYSPGTLIAGDADMIEYFQWAATLR
jgi:nitrite reductase/ring-hydroxylating ferredoxin subunit